MAVTLAITDSGAGTGTATVAGSNASATNTLYKAAWTGQTGSLTFTSVGSRTGDGTIALTGAGTWLWRLDSVHSGTTTVVATYQPLADPTDSLQVQVMEAFQTRIRELDLTGIEDANVKIRWIPRKLQSNTTDPVPAVIISPLGAEDFPGGTNAQDDIGLPVLVTVIDQQNNDLTANLDRNTLWRQRILSALRFQRLAGITEVYNVVPVPTSTLDLGAWKDGNLYFSVLAFRAVTRTARG